MHKVELGLYILPIYVEDIINDEFYEQLITNVELCLGSLG